MSLVKQLSRLAMHQVLGDRADSVLGFLGDRFSDCSQRVPVALRSANQRAWKTLEISLTGSSWLERGSQKLAAAEEQALRKLIQSFLTTAPLPRGRDEPEFRKLCLAELRTAYKANHLPGVDMGVEDVQDIARDFARFGNAQDMVHAELQSVEHLVEGLEGLGYYHLAEFVALRPDRGPPLLVLAVRYYFRREVESDPKLSATLTFQQLEGLSAGVESGFRSLHEALTRHHDKLNELLADVHEIVTETREDVRDMKEELQRISRLLQGQQPPAARPDQTHAELERMRSDMDRQTRQMQELYEMAFKAMQLLQAQAASAPATPPVVAVAGPTTPASSEAESLEQVQALMARCQELPREQRRRMPALFRAVTRLNLTARAGAKNPFGLVKDGRSLRLETEWQQDSGGPAPPHRTHIPTYPGEAATASPAEPIAPAQPCGKPLGKLFQNGGVPAPPASEATAPTAEVTPPPAAGNARLVSSIFLQGQPPADAATESPQSAGQDSTADKKAIRGKPQSPLFRPRPPEGGT